MIKIKIKIIIILFKNRKIFKKKLLKKVIQINSNVLKIIKKTWKKIKLLKKIKIKFNKII